MIWTYHKIGRQFELGITTVRRQAFGVHLDLLKSLEMDFVLATQGAESKQQEVQIAITFDDGYASVWSDALPEMEMRGIRGTVFPVVGSIGGYNDWDIQFSHRRLQHLSWAEIKCLAEKGFEIGSHTLTHKDLTKLDQKSLRRELRVSRMLLEDRTGACVKALSYPFGRFSRIVIEEALEAGYTYGFTSFPRPPGNRMAIGRMGIYSIDTLGSLRRKLGLARGYGLEWLKSRAIAALSRGTTLVKR